jgi:pilus assembly protein CpaB
LNSRVRVGLIVAVVGLFLITVGIFLAARFLNLGLGGFTQTPVIPTPVPVTTIQVVFATKDVAAGTVLTENDIKLSDVPPEFAPRNTMASLDKAVGKISKVDLTKGEMVLSSSLADPTGSAYDISYILDDRHVLMALPATDLMSSKAIIKRGDIVDIMVTIQENLEPATTGQTQDQTNAQPDAGIQQVTFTVSQKLNITAMVADVIKQDPNATDANADTAPAPTRDQIKVQMYLLALDPQDALVIKYLKDKGGIFEFVIRSPTSTANFEITPVTSKFIKELYGLELLP